MIQEAIKVLCSALRAESLDRKKAEVLCKFAEDLSTEVLRQAGVFEPDDSSNRLAWELDTPDYPPEDVFTSLVLYNTPPMLDISEGDFPPFAHELLMGRQRVVEWNSDTKRVVRSMSYEEAARFVILWFAGKILEIMRENQWDRIERLPDLYDRLANFGK